MQLERSEINIVLLDTMVPRQRVELQFGPPVSGMLAKARESGELIGVLGMNQRNGEILRRGVEARIESMSPYRASHGFFSSHSTTPMRGFTAQETALVGGRRFEIVEADERCLSWPPDRPCFKATVRWLGEPGSLAALEGASPAAIAQSEALGPLVTEWIELVCSTNRERQPGQIKRVLSDIGAIPDPENPDDRAFWTAALINPMPALGVAREVRPAVLEARDSAGRVEAVYSALVDSIARLREMPPGPFEVEPRSRPS
jgi:hypothetical protein